MGWGYNNVQFKILKLRNIMTCQLTVVCDEGWSRAPTTTTNEISSSHIVEPNASSTEQFSASKCVDDVNDQKKQDCR